MVTKRQSGGRSVIQTIMSHIFRADATSKEVTNDCTLCPSQVTKNEAFWLHAKNDKYSLDEIDMKKIGKWMIFPLPSIVDDIWDKVKEGVKQGFLWHAKVSTRNSDKPNYTHAVIIYSKDFEDKADVVSVLDYLESSGIKPEGYKIYYKTDQQTYAGVYANISGQKRQKSSIYDSVSIRQEEIRTNNADSDKGKKANVSQSEDGSSPKKKKLKQKTFDELSDFFASQKK